MSNQALVAEAKAIQREDYKSYVKEQAREYEVKRLLADAQHGERLVLEHFNKLKPRQPEVRLTLICWTIVALYAVICARTIMHKKPSRRSSMALLCCLQCEELFKRAFQLEDAGHVEEAIKLYQKVLAGEPHNLELRQYIQKLVSAVNSYASMQKSSMRQSHKAKELQGKGAGVSLQLQAFEREPDLRRGRKPQGTCLLGANA